MLDWSPDGANLTCSSRAGGALRLQQVSLAGGAPKLLAEISDGPNDITGLAWNDTGDSLAVCLQFATFDVILLEGVGQRIRSLAN